MSSDPIPSEIIFSPGSTTFYGPDAVHLFRALTLRNSIQLYAKTGLTPCKGMGITKMLSLSTEFTNQKYKRTQAPQAISDLTIWIETMRSALPITHED